MKHHVRLTVVFSTLLLIQTVVFAQTARLYDSGTGLPNTQINDLCQAGSGMLWVATNNGLYRFDGMNFQEFHHQEANPGSVGSEMVLRVLEDSRGVTWVGTAKGLQIFDPESNTFSEVTLDDSARSHYIYGLVEVPLGHDRSGILVSASDFGMYFLDPVTHVSDSTRRSLFTAPEHSTHVNSLFVDSKNRIWASSEIGGVFVYDSQGHQILEDMWTGADASLRSKAIATSFAEDPASGDIIIGTTNYGLLVFDESEGSIKVPSDPSTRSCKVMSLMSGKRFQLPGQNPIIVGTENQGLKRYVPSEGKLYPLSLPNVPYNTDKWKVHNLLEDNQGNLWVSAYQIGLMIVPQSMFGFRYFSFRLGDSPGQESSCLTSGTRDAANKRSWIGSDGSGLFCLSDNGGMTNLNSTNSALPDDSVMSLVMDKRGTLWVATFLDGLVTYTEKNGFKRFRDSAKVGSEKVFCLVYDEDDDILYAGTHGNGVAVIDPFSESVVRTVSEGINQWISTLMLDRSGTLWIGTYDGHWCFNPDSGQLFRMDLEQTGLANARTHSIMEAKDGTIWMGTGEGLVKLDRSTGKTKVYTELDGLSDEVISGILEGDDGSIWVSTAYGLTRINPQTGQTARYYESDGLQGNEFRINAQFKSSRGQLFFGGTKGLTAFYPQVVDQKLHDVPPVILTRLTVANREAEYDARRDDNFLDKHITEATVMTLPYSSNSFSLDFSVPEFTNPERIRYTYRLSRFDSDWHTASAANRSATYTNLPHGRYTMTVKAFYDGNEENASTRSIEVRVLPPWWLSFWAFLLYAALAAAAIAAGIALHRKNRQQRLHEEESALKEAKLQMFTNISHEIRTPLNLVMSPLRKLMENETDPEQKGNYAMMYRNASIILGKMNDFEESRRQELAAGEPGQEHEQSVPTPEEDEAKAVKSRKNILLVDENAEMLSYLKMELRKYFNVETCADADEAWAKAVSTHPDAIVTDILTGGSMSGTDLCEKVKHNPGTNLIPVLILTSQWDDATIRRCTESGADRYLVKPVSVELLRTTVQQTIATRETIRNKYINDVPYDYDEITMPSADDKFLPKVVEIIKEHISEPGFGVEELSREAGMSRVHLNRKLKETISISPGNFIKSIRLKQAAYLLVNNKVNISEVAFKVGFSTHSYFSSTFKDYFGLSPKEFVAKYSDPSRKEELDRLLDI